MRDDITDDEADRFTRQLEEGFNRRDDALIESLISEHFIDHSVLLGGMDLRHRIHRVQEAFPDATYAVVDRLVQGNAVAWRWTIRGTHAKQILGTAPTGRVVMLPGMTVAVIREGKAVEQWEFADIPALLDQLQGPA